eukprot:TCONS_00054318-protein
MPIMRASAAVQSGGPPPTRRNNSNVENRKSTFTPENRKSRSSLSNTNLTSSQNSNINNGNNKQNIASYGSQTQFKASFTISRDKDDTPACFKQDGERFTNEQTLKLYSAADYTVKMEIAPNMELLYIKFGGVETPFKSTNDPEKDQKSIYQFLWSTKGIDPTENRHRTDVLCSMKFKNFKEIEFRLQVKFYTLQKMKHATWGEKLNSISMDCTAGRGTYQSFVEKMKYI